VEDQQTKIAWNALALSRLPPEPAANYFNGFGSNLFGCIKAITDIVL
jgi:hypothetical protein